MTLLGWLGRKTSTQTNKIMTKPSRKHAYIIWPLKPQFYTVKLWFTGVNIIFLISSKKYRVWVLVRTASSIYFLSRNMKNIRIFFYLKIFIFLEVKYSVYFNKRVFVILLFKLTVRHNLHDSFFVLLRVLFCLQEHKLYWTRFCRLGPQLMTNICNISRYHSMNKFNRRQIDVIFLFSPETGFDTSCKLS